MTSQIGGAEVFEIDDNGKVINEIPKCSPSPSPSPSPSSSPSPSEIKKHEERQRKMYGHLIEGLVKIYETKPSSRAPEIDADTKEMVDKITGYIKQIMDALNIPFDGKAYQSVMKEMGYRLYTFMKQGGHSKSKGKRSNSKGKRSNSKGRRVWRTVRGGMRPSRMPENRARSASPAGYQPPHSDEDDSSSASWRQHFIMLFLLLSSIFMVYIANVKFHQTLQTITQSGTFGELNDITLEISRALQKLESGDFIEYIFKIFSKPQADIELYYTGQLRNIIKDVVDRSVKKMSAQIKATCGGEDIFQEGALAVGPIDITNAVNVITNAIVSTLNSGETTKCITQTVQAMTREEFHKIETQITLVVAKILHGKNIISWLLSGATAFGVPPLGWFSRLFWTKLRYVMRRRQGVSAAHEHDERPDRGDGGFLALPAPGGGGRKTRYRFRRVVKGRTRKN